MRVGHGDEAALGDPGGPALRVGHPQEPGQHPPAQVQLLAVAEHPVGGQVQPGPALGPEAQGQPVGQVDQVLVLDLAARDPADRPVVDPGGVGAGVVDVGGGGLGGGPAGRDVAVAEGAQRLPEPLGGRVEAVVGQSPGADRSPCRTRPPPTASSPRSATTMSAPRSARAAAWSPRSTPMTSPNPPRRPASTPARASSTTAARPGSTPSRRAAARNSAGSGLPGSPSRAASIPSTSANWRSLACRARRPSRGPVGRPGRPRAGRCPGWPGTPPPRRSAGGRRRGAGSRPR